MNDYKTHYFVAYDAFVMSVYTMLSLFFSCLHQRVLTSWCIWYAHGFYLFAFVILIALIQICVIYLCSCLNHDDVIKWNHFPRYWPFVRGIHRSPSQTPATRTCDVFFDLRLNNMLSKQSRRRWFETPPRSLRRHCNGSLIDTTATVAKPQENTNSLGTYVIWYW